MSAQVVYLQQYRVHRLLQQGAAFVFVDNTHPGVQGLEDQRAKFPRGLVPIQVTNHPLMQPAMHVTCWPDALRFNASFGGLKRQVLVPWQAVLRSELRAEPPRGGGTPLKDAV